MQRRHRLANIELEPVRIAIRQRLSWLLKERSDFESAEALFRVLFRIKRNASGQPGYPKSLGWAEIEAFLREAVSEEGLQCRKAVE